jgi:hypothetical protein
MGFFGKADTSHPGHNNGWEPFSNLNISGAWEPGDWSEVFAKAQRLGVSYEDEGGAVVMWKGRSQGRFLNTKGGQSLACEFLGGVA